MRALMSRNVNEACVSHCVGLYAIQPHQLKHLQRGPSAYVSICQHTPAYACIRQHTSAYASIRQLKHLQGRSYSLPAACPRSLRIRINKRIENNDVRGDATLAHALNKVVPLQLLRCQYLYFCISKASKLTSAATPRSRMR
jgi:hypothetical protein